jgi:hypothetical protein
LETSLPVWFLHCFMQLPPHATATVVEDATTARSSPLLHRRHLQLRHTTACWRGPHPLPLTGRWSPRTLTPLHGVIRGGRVSSTVGVAPTELHRSKGPRHQAVTGRMREEKKKTTSAGRWRSAGRHTSLLVHGAIPKDHRHQGPRTHRRPC